MSGAQAASLVPEHPLQALTQTWDRQVWVCGLGGAFDGEFDLAPEIANLCQRGPFKDSDLPQFTERVLVARTLLVAIRRALEALGTDQLPSPERRAIVLGSQTAAMSGTVDFLTQIDKYGAHLVNPGLFPFTVMNAPSGIAAIQFDCQGANITLNNGATSALDAMAQGADLLASDQADLVLVGGFEGLDANAAELMGRPRESHYVAVILALVRPSTSEALNLRPLCELAAFCRATNSSTSELLHLALDAAAGPGAKREHVFDAQGDGRHHESTLFALLRALHGAQSAEAGALTSITTQTHHEAANAALVLRASARC